jgi:hypothetical protein
VKVALDKAILLGNPTLALSILGCDLAVDSPVVKAKMYCGRFQKTRLDCQMSQLHIFAEILAWEAVGRNQRTSMGIAGNIPTL